VPAFRAADPMLSTKVLAALLAPPAPLPLDEADCELRERERLGVAAVRARDDDRAVALGLLRELALRAVAPGLLRELALRAVAPGLLRELALRAVAPGLLRELALRAVAPAALRALGLLRAPELLPAPALRLLAWVARPLDERELEAMVGPSFSVGVQALYPATEPARTRSAEAQRRP
jgi:hypothetical protein